MEPITFRHIIVMTKLQLLVFLPMTTSAGVGVLQTELWETAASLQPDTPENLD